MYASTIRAATSFVSSANISSLNAGNFGASRIDVTLLSSLTGDITFNLVSTLSLFGNVDVNLGLGNQIAGLIGGAASQGLGVALGGAALATGAVALITGRTSGGANSNVFQTVNGTTQLQFSTLGSATTSVFFDTNSPSPGTTPALQTSTTTTIAAGTYCVRSVSDPLNINNNVSTIQSFGEWIPVIQNNPTLPSFTTSTLTLSSLVTASAGISSLSVSSIGGNVRMSSIQVSGNISSTNANATFSWGAPGLGTTINNTTVNMPYVTLSTLNVLGDTQAQQVFGLSGNFNTLVASNAVSASFVTGSNWVSTPQLTVSSINGNVYPPPNFLLPSTLAVSTLLAKSAEISTLAVSTVGGVMRTSTILPTGNITSQNFSATLTWGSPGFQTILSQTSTVMANARANTLTVLGDTFANQVFGSSGNFNTVTGSNQINGSFITGSNWISTPALTVSSINGSLFPAPTPPIFLASTITATGNITSANVSATGTVVGAVVQASGLLTSLNTFNANIINLLGDINTSNALATANFVTINTSTINASSITSKGGSVSSMVVSTINGQAYPPPNFGLLLPSTVFLSTVNVNGNFAGSNTSGSFGWPGVMTASSINTSSIRAGVVSTTVLRVDNIPSLFSQGYINSLGTSTIQIGRAFPGGGVGYQYFSGDGIRAFGIDIPSPFGLEVAGGNILANSVSTTSLVTPLVKAGEVSTPVLRVNNINGLYSQGYINSLGTSTIQIPRVFPGGSIGYQSFNENGVRAFGVEIPDPFGLNMSGANTLVGGPLNVQGLTTMSNAQAYGITANTLTASNTVQGDVITGRVIQATQNLTTPLMTIQNLNVQQVAGISTGVVSSLFTNFINNLPYPPTSGVTGDTPSTMYASTVFIDGGLTVRGLGQNFITRANISSLSSVSVTGLLNASTVLFNGGMTNTGNLPIITSNLSAVNINNVSFINGQVYPPPIGSVALQSTLFLSTVLVNGGQTMNGNGALTMNGPSLNFIDTSFPRINGYITANSGTLQTALIDNTAYTITRGSTIASTLMFMANDGRVRFTSSMSVRDPVPLGTPSQAYIQTYSSGLEAPAGSVITANVSSPSINTSSITLAGSGSRIAGDVVGMGPGINFLTNDFQIFSASGTTQYLDMSQGVGAYTGGTFFNFGALNNPATAFITAGNYWTYVPQVGAIPAGGVVTSNISTISLVANTINTPSMTGSNAFFGNTSTNTLWAGNISTPTISVSSINNFTALPSVSGNIQMILDTTNGAGGFGSFQIQPQSTLYIKSALSIGSAGGLSDTLRQYAASSIGFAQVNPHIVLSADSIVSTANISWGFAKDNSPPITTSLSYFINNLSTSKTNVKTTLGWLGLPNSELYNVLDTTLTPGYLAIKNTTNSVIYVEGVPQYASATTAPYGI